MGSFDTLTMNGIVVPFMYNRVCWKVSSTVRGELVEPWWPMLDDGGLGCDL